MRIGIIGGGSIGLLFASKLAAVGAEVTIWTRTEEQAFVIAAEGIRLWDAEGGEHTIVAGGEWLSRERLAKMEAGRLERADWYLLALKQTDLSKETAELIAELIRRTPDRPPLLCIQNGTGHLGKLTAASAGDFSIYNAVTSSGAKREDMRSVRHTGQGSLFLARTPERSQGERRAERSEDDFRQKMLLNFLNRAGFDASLSNDIHNRVFQKLLINAVINPLTALYDMRNGELPAHPARRSLMKALHDETKPVLLAAGMKEWPDSWESVLGVCERTSCNVSSMLADVRAGKGTEIDSINGEIARMAAARGLSAPLNESMLRLVEALGKR
ncbi:2-dehydropantoate 2-reductase [Paenibacillus sp. PAMC21692]|uniref:2-dehydropantoate 2-reductase n=1 Tax=Paenibacillus sp. PAMC21692 TaxID=2762320 RepID=UPI00164E1EC5|nr:2-dehydropantoate 2-reductase [Paenibacillus sp. PAMC21692]QNK54488.1 2-dehydropantoate 2-reductase [Paenibacillus sp. PAMC21692]